MSEATRLKLQEQEHTRERVRYNRRQEEKSEIEENPFEHIFDEQDENEAQKLKKEDSEKGEKGKTILH